MSLKVHIIGDSGTPAVDTAVKICLELGCVITGGECDVAIAPLLTRRVTADEIACYGAGLLVFHPSLLPTRRGGDAIKWAYRHGDNIGGVTWFWASDVMDGGDICSQEAFPINRGIPPREHYNTAVLPALARTLKTAITEFKNGYFRRVPQVHSNATFDFKIKCESHA